jgi:hypothetical protein
MECSKSPSPLNMESTIIIDAEITATATTDMIEITFMKFFFRLDRR